MDTPEKATDQTSLPILTPKSASGSQRVIKQIVVIDPNKLRLAGLDVKMAEALKKSKSPKTKQIGQSKSSKESKLAYAKTLLSKKLNEVISKKQSKAGQLPSSSSPTPAVNSVKSTENSSPHVSSSTAKKNRSAKPKISVANLKSLMPPPSFPMSSLISPNQTVEIKVLKAENTTQSIEVKIVDAATESPKKIDTFPKASLKPTKMQTIIKTEAITSEIKFGVRKTKPCSREDIRRPKVSLSNHEESKPNVVVHVEDSLSQASIKDSKQKETPLPVEEITAASNVESPQNEHCKSLMDTTEQAQNEKTTKSLTDILESAARHEPTKPLINIDLDSSLEETLVKESLSENSNNTHFDATNTVEIIETPTNLDERSVGEAVEIIPQTPSQTEIQSKPINNTKMVVQQITTSTTNRRESLPQVIESKVLSPDEKIDLSLLTNKTPIGLTVPKKRYKLDQNYITSEPIPEDESIYLDLSAVTQPSPAAFTPKVEESAVDFINNLSLLFAESQQSKSEAKTIADSLTKECSEDATSFLVTLFQKKQGSSPESSTNISSDKTNRSPQSNEMRSPTNKEIEQQNPSEGTEVIENSVEVSTKDTEALLPNQMHDEQTEPPTCLVDSSTSPTKVDFSASLNSTSQNVSSSKDELDTPKSSIPSRRKTSKPIPVLVPKLRKSRKPPTAATPVQNPPEEPKKQHAPTKPTEEPVEESPTQPVKNIEVPKDPVLKTEKTSSSSQKSPLKREMDTPSSTDIQPTPTTSNPNISKEISISNSERPKRQRKISLKLAESSEMRSTLTSSFQGIIDGTVEKAMKKKQESAMTEDKPQRHRKVSFKLSDSSEAEMKPPHQQQEATAAEKPQRQSNITPKLLQSPEQIPTVGRSPQTPSDIPQRQRKTSLKQIESAEPSQTMKEQEQPPVAPQTGEKESDELIAFPMIKVVNDPIAQLDAFHETVEKFEMACGSLKSKRVQDIAIDTEGEGSSLSEYPFRDAIPWDSPMAKSQSSSNSAVERNSTRVLRKRKNSLKSRNFSGEQIAIVSNDFAEKQTSQDTLPVIQQSVSSEQSFNEENLESAELMQTQSELTSHETPSTSVAKKRKGRQPKVPKDLAKPEVSTLEKITQGSTDPEENITLVNNYGGSWETLPSTDERTSEGGALADKNITKSTKKKTSKSKVNNSKDKNLDDTSNMPEDEFIDVVEAPKDIATPHAPKRKGRQLKARKANISEEKPSKSRSKKATENEENTASLDVSGLDNPTKSELNLSATQDYPFKDIVPPQNEIPHSATFDANLTHEKQVDLFDEIKSTPVRTLNSIQQQAKEGTKTSTHFEDLAFDLDHIESPSFSPICDSSRISEDSNGFEDTDRDDTVTEVEKAAEQVSVQSPSVGKSRADLNDSTSSDKTLNYSSVALNKSQESSMQKEPQNDKPTTEPASEDTSSLYCAVYIKTANSQTESKNKGRRQPPKRNQTPSNARRQAGFLGFDEEEIVEGQHSTSLRLSQSDVDSSLAKKSNPKQNESQRARKPKQVKETWEKKSAKSLTNWLTNPSVVGAGSSANNANGCEKEADPKQSCKTVNSARNQVKQRKVMPPKLIDFRKQPDNTNAIEEEQPVIVKTEPIEKIPPAPRKPSRRKRSLPAQTESPASEPPAKKKYKDETEFNPRLLLIRRKEELKSTEPLVDPSLQIEPNGPDDIQCALCMGYTTKKTWMKHISSHYGVGWIVGQPPPLDIHYRSSVLNYFVEFFKSTKIKGMNCRICNSFRRSGLGLFLHLEQCCLTQEEISRVVCEYCKKDYTKSSYLIHKRNCREYLKKIVEESKALETVASTEGTAQSQEDVLTNTGRLKRKSVIKAETKLKSLNETPDFIPEELVKHIPSTNIPSIEAIRERWNMEINSLSKGFCASKKCTFTATTIEDLDEHYVETICQYFEKPGYFCMKCKFYSENDKDAVVQHVMKNHLPRQPRKCDDGDAEIDSSESSDSISSGDEEVDSGEGGGSEDGNDSVERKSKRTRKTKTKSRRRPLVYKSAPTKEYKKLLPERRSDIQQLVRKQYDKFIATNYSCDALFTFAKPTHSYLEGSEPYFPKSTDSIKFTHEGFHGFVKALGRSRVSSDQWKQLERLHGMTEKDEYTIYMGGPVKNLAWVPLDPNPPSNTQYLAVTVRKDLDKFSRFCNQKLSRSLIFILKFDINQPASEIKAEISYAIAIDEGPIHAIAFLPSGGYSPGLNRLGMLAVACIETEIKIYSLPLSVEKRDCDMFPIVRLDTALALHLVLREDNSLPDDEMDSYCSQCTCLVWSQTAGHNIIVGGYLNGFVGIWDICDDADNLNRFDVNGKIRFTPVSYFWTSEDRLMHLALHYDLDGPRWLAASNSMRKVMIYDLRDITQPTLIRIEVTLNSISDIEWPIVWENVMFSLGDAMPSNGCVTSVISPMNIIYSIRRVDKFCTGVSVMDYNIWQNSVASGADNGDVQVVPVREAVLDVSQRLKTDSKTVSTLDIVPLMDHEISRTGIQIPPDGMRVFDKDFKNNYGIVFGSVKKLSAFKKPDYYSTQRVPPFNLQRLVRINKLKYNQNKSACNVLAIGYNNGLLRVLAKDWLQE